MPVQRIENFRGAVVQTPQGKAELVWNSDFADVWQGKYERSQVFVDSEVLRLCEPYIPLDTSMLIKSGILGTIPGRGYVEWIAPYARYQYYLYRKTASQTGPLRGSFWFHRMAETHGRTIIAGARKIMREESGRK